MKDSSLNEGSKLIVYISPKQTQENGNCNDK